MIEHTEPQPHQRQYIAGIVINTDTVGMDAGTAYRITLFELSIELHKLSILNLPGGIPRLTRKHREAGFSGLVKQVNRRNILLKRG